MAQAFTVEDLYLHRKITELDCSARGDATLAACSVRSVDRANDKYLTHIWTFDLASGQARQATTAGDQNNSPQWSPDGASLAFISNRSGSPQVHLLQRAGGEATQLSRHDGALSQLRWAPDSRWLAATAAVAVDPDWRGERANGRKPKERGPASPCVAWKLPYKSDGPGYVLAREIHLFRLDAASSDMEQLTDGPFDVMGFAVSPNGKHIAYVRTREGRFSHRTDLWVCDSDGTHHRQLTRELAMVLDPVWSPDGQSIAFAGSRAEGDAQENLWQLTFASGKLECLGGESLNVALPGALHWEAGGKSLVFAQAHRGRHRAVRMHLPDQRLEVLVDGDVQFGAFAQAGTGFAYTAEHPAQPCELYACAPDGSGRRAISDLNAWWRERTPIDAVAREFEVPDGRGGMERIEGWLLHAKGASGPMPLLNDVHGGPASYALLDFDTNVFWQVLCSKGWAILALNAVGSASYGREFCDRLQGHWGEADLPQHLAAVRQLQEQGVADARLAISGKSYGGYLSAWATGHTDQFRAAVVMAPVGNIETHYGTSDGGYYADPLYMGSKRFDRKLANKLSPLQHIEKSKTPTLFMQGQDDERCPKCQSEEMFVSLMCAQDTPAELVLYPGEGHTFLGEGKPSVREDAARRIVDWLQAHIAVTTQGQRAPQARAAQAA